MIRDFPWDLSRKIYSENVMAGPAGVSFDWEFLLSSAFVDAKCIICEWLQLRRLTKTTIDDFADLVLASVDVKLKKLIGARAELFGRLGYFDMIARAFLYMSGIYAEEIDILAAFTGLMSSAVRKDVGQALLSVPDITKLATWLHEAVTLDLKSLPAILLVSLTSVDNSQTLQYGLTSEIALQMLGEHFSRRFGVLTSGDEVGADLIRGNCSISSNHTGNMVMQLLTQNQMRGTSVDDSFGFTPPNAAVFPKNQPIFYSQPFPLLQNFSEKL